MSERKLAGSPRRGTPSCGAKRSCSSFEFLNSFGTSTTGKTRGYSSTGYPYKVAVVFPYKVAAVFPTKWPWKKC